MSAESSRHTAVARRTDIATATARTHATRTLAFRALLIGMIGAAACGDDGPSEPLADCLADAGVTGPAVAIRGFAFSPATLRIAPGEEVTWVNCEPANVDPHTTTSDAGVWGSGLLSPGDTFVREFPEAGTFPYHCVPHPSMQAEVIVEEEA